MKKTNYQKPEVKEEVKVIEPVETGCCLRLCEGSPHHLNTAVSQDIKNFFEKTE